MASNSQMKRGSVGGAGGSGSGNGGGSGSGSGGGGGAGGRQGKDDKLKEEEIEQALKHLNLLHVKCRELRTTIPRMLEPLPANHNSEDVYHTFVKSLVSATNEIKDFGALYNNETSQKVLEQAKKSRDANPKGIKPWRAKDHPDWLDNAQ